MLRAEVTGLEYCKYRLATILKNPEPCFILKWLHASMHTNTYCLSTNGDLGERDKCREAKIPFAHDCGDAITTKLMPATTNPYITVIEARSDAHPTNFLPARSQVLDGICNFYEFATKCTYVAVLFNQLVGSVSLDLLFTVIHILVCVCLHSCCILQSREVQFGQAPLSSRIGGSHRLAWRPAPIHTNCTAWPGTLPCEAGRGHPGWDTVQVSGLTCIDPC